MNNLVAGVITSTSEIISDRKTHAQRSVARRCSLSRSFALLVNDDSGRPVSAEGRTGKGTGRFEQHLCPESTGPQSTHVSRGRSQPGPTAGSRRTGAIHAHRL